MKTRLISALLVGGLAIAACGGSDDSSSATTVPVPDATDGPTTTIEQTGDEPVPTISPDVPPEFIDGIGPMAAVGASLEILPDDPSAPDPAIGQTAPVLIGEDLDGAPFRLDAGESGPTWVVFLAHWCPHCNDEIPVINEMRDDGLIPDDIDVVGVSTASNPGRPNWPPDEWLVDLDWTFPATLDGIDVERQTYIAADAFGLSAFPFSVLLDGDGIVVDRWSGNREPSELVELLAQL